LERQGAKANLAKNLTEQFHTCKLLLDMKYLLLHDIQVNNMITKVGTRGQVSIPKEIRKKFKIESETRIEWFVDGKTIRVLPIPKDPVKAFRGKGNRTYTTDDLIKDRKQERSLEDVDDGKK